MDYFDSLFVENDCYHIRLKTKNKLVTNFVFKNPVETYAVIGENKRRVSVKVDIFQRGSFVCCVCLPEDAWASPAKFKRAISGITNLAFLGSGSKELQLIKLSLIGM
ncbi:hypothetical protein [Azotobacter chroococcum]|uniref:hypothetical protein n=1 Tax=Azotobacter chroococcum TaxID=353 RepID=UPI0010AE4362|nr:hypothetical protein [Azotobacter chroococcum]TKD46812.1 hypothetical protein FCG41_01225 [Azotobacter chroococcum]